MLDQKAKIERISQEVSVRLALVMEECIHMEIQHMRNRRLNKIIEEMIRIVKCITAQIARIELAEGADLKNPCHIF
jgi:hypothetical protein